jgi:hypothetical protein
VADSAEWNGNATLDGKVLPGWSKSANYGYGVPKKHWGDVVLEFNPDYERDSVLFEGSLT